MSRKIERLFLVFALLIVCNSLFSQDTIPKPPISRAIIDSLKRNGYVFIDSIRKPDIKLTTGQAVQFLQERYQQQNWHNPDDPLRKALGQLIFEASNPPFDTARAVLKAYPYDSLSIPWDKFYIWEPVRIELPGVQPTDTSVLVVIDTLREVRSEKPGFPLKYMNYPFQSDSIKVAVNALLDYLERRDSSIISFSGIGNHVSRLWLNSATSTMTRFWLKNEYADSVTVWIGNAGRDTIGLYLEQGVAFRRPGRQENYSAARINVETIDKSKLLNAKNITVKTAIWRTRSESSFILSQAALSNWVKGGENSISTSMDITGYADYTNNPKKLSSYNFIRLKLGFLKSGVDPIRKNLDLFETNSKLNHKAFGKFDFSAVLLFKTQVAPGYNYNTNQQPFPMVSKFFNPAILTAGLGLDYKPDKQTSIYFSPFSYKGTFVPDTANIDQTKYGIPKDRKSLNEPGASVMVTNTFRPVKNLMLTNRLQLFTNYRNNPQNIDVDWEMIAVLNLNWFTDVRFNTHLIFDDDTKTPVMGEGHNPELNPDGSVKKTARIQFKELLGISLVFRF